MATSADGRPRVFLSAGEASGDAYGAALVRELRRMASLQIEGIGGPRMRAEGVATLADTSRWGAISIVQSIGVVPRVTGGYLRAKAALARGAPGLFVPIDFGFANIRLARHAKQRGWRVLYFVPPGSWRRDRQGRDLPQITDAISTPFSWSADLLRNAGAQAHWFGHPIKQLLGERGSSVERGETVAVLPGSRSHEIAENLPIIAAAVEAVPEAWSSGISPVADGSLGRRLEFALAPSVDVAAFQEAWRRLAPNRSEDLFTQGDTQGVLLRARAAIVCSGTATLEAALSRCPMVVVYRMSRSMVLEAKLIGFKRPKYIALPNILMDRTVVPELVQDEASPSVVRAHVDALLQDGEARAGQLRTFDDLDALLGPSDAITRTAELAMSLIEPGKVLS